MEVLLLITKIFKALISVVHSLFNKSLRLFSSSSNLPISTTEGVSIDGGSPRDDARGTHRNKHRTGGAGKIMSQLCFGAALLMLSYSQQLIQLNYSLPQSPQQQVSQLQGGSLPAFQLLEVFFVLGFSLSLGGVLLSFIYPFAAKVLETMGTVFGVLGFFLAMGIVVDIYFKSLLWVMCLAGAISLVFILINAVHELRGLGKRN